jgi:hypothetical protein
MGKGEEMHKGKKGSGRYWAGECNGLELWAVTYTSGEETVSAARVFFCLWK